MNTGGTYATAEASRNWGHAMEYSFDWGDGDSSPWSTSTTASHAWITVGVKTVIVTARRQVHTSLLAASSALTVSVLPVEVVSVPGTPAGNQSPIANASETYSTTESTCNWGHTVEYSFNWGDGATSPWSTSTGASHAWNTSGTKNVTVTALPGSYECCCRLVRAGGHGLAS